jgi:DNA-binding phage protein
MPTRKTAFDRYVDEQMKSPTFAAEYARVGAEIRAVDDLIRAVDDTRVALGMTKADLARKISTTPEAVRRLLTSGDANPTLKTILDVLEALGLRLAVVKSDSPSSFDLVDFMTAKMKKRASTSRPMSFASKPAPKTPSRQPNLAGLTVSKPVSKKSHHRQHGKTA